MKVRNTTVSQFLNRLLSLKSGDSEEIELLPVIEATPAPNCVLTQSSNAGGNATSATDVLVHGFLVSIANTAATTASTYTITFSAQNMESIRLVYKIVPSVANVINESLMFSKPIRIPAGTVAAIGFDAACSTQTTSIICTRL